MVGGEPIICRIIRQVRERGDEPIVVTHNRNIMAIVDTDIFVPRSRATTCNTLLSTAPLWHGYVRVLLGDVVYSKYAMDAIMNDGRFQCTFGDLWEIYALIFHTDIYGGEVAYAAEKAAEYKKGKLRYLYRYLRWQDVKYEDTVENLHDHAQFWYKPSGDYTFDMDNEDRYRRFVSTVMKRGRLDDKQNP